LLADSGAHFSKVHPALIHNHAILPRSALRKAAVVLSNKILTVSAAATFMGCSVSTVTRNIRRMKNTCDFGDLPRTGRPAVYSDACKLKLTGFYCQSQPFANSGRWTLRLAAMHLAVYAETVGVSPSKSTIHRILKENNLKPHQSRYFLHITDPDFFPKMEHLINLYLNPPSNLFFFDECPGIQILKRLIPDLRTDSMKKRLEEFEYIRNGTMNVLAFFNYADGKVYAECQADHKTDTFLEVFKRHVASCSDTEQVHYVMDNLSTHRGYPFCEAVAELSSIPCPSKNELDNLAKRVDWLMSTDKRIIIHFTPYHGSWLNLVEFWFGIMNKKVLNESYGLADELMKAFEAFLDEWNTILAHPFRWSYTGKGLHGKAIKRFTEVLKHSASKLEISSLTKQLRLISNLFEQYFSDVPIEYWEEFFIVLRTQEETLRNIINREEGPRKKKNGEDALNILLMTTNNYLCQNRQKAA